MEDIDSADNTRNNSVIVDKFITHKQLAEKLGVCPEYLNKVRDAWGIPYIRLSIKAVRYSEKQIDLWLKAKGENDVTRI